MGEEEGRTGRKGSERGGGGEKMGRKRRVYERGGRMRRREEIAFSGAILPCSQRLSVGCPPPSPTLGKYA